MEAFKGFGRFYGPWKASSRRVFDYNDPMPDRTEFRQIAEERLLDAQALLGAGRWSAAYYLAGYAVECALKACILARIEREPHVIFQERRFADDCWTHNAEKLMDKAGLVSDMNRDSAANPDLGTNWYRIKQWKEDVRYRETEESRARELVLAITDPENGVLSWLKARW